jgi:hypothetical protein
MHVLELVLRSKPIIRVSYDYDKFSTAIPKMAFLLTMTAIAVESVRLYPRDW